VPGATSNQPPQQNQAPINSNNAPVLQAANGTQRPIS
jgi:hypothetical protein